MNKIHLLKFSFIKAAFFVAVIFICTILSLSIIKPNQANANDIDTSSSNDFSWIITGDEKSYGEVQYCILDIFYDTISWKNSVDVVNDTKLSDLLNAFAQAYQGLYLSQKIVSEDTKTKELRISLNGDSDHNAIHVTAINCKDDSWFTCNSYTIPTDGSSVYIKSNPEILNISAPISYELPASMSITDLDTGKPAIPGDDYVANVYEKDTKIEIKSNNLKVSGNADVPEQAYITVNNTNGGINTLTIENIDLLMPDDVTYEWSEDPLIYIDSNVDFNLHIKGKCTLNSYYYVGIMLSTDSNEEVNFTIDGDVNDEFNFNTIFNEDENSGGIIFDPDTYEVDHKLQFLGSLNLNFHKRNSYGGIGWFGSPFSTLIFGENTTTTVYTHGWADGSCINWIDGSVIIKDNAKVILDNVDIRSNSYGILAWSLEVLNNASLICNSETACVLLNEIDKAREGYGDFRISTTGEVWLHSFNSTIYNREGNIYFDNAKQINIISDVQPDDKGAYGVQCSGGKLYINTDNVYITGHSYSWIDQDYLLFGAFVVNDEDSFILNDKIKMYGSEVLKDDADNINKPCSIKYNTYPGDMEGWTPCIDDSTNDDLRIAKTVRFVKTKYNVTGTVTDADNLWNPVAGAFVQFCKLTPWGEVPIAGQYAYTDMFGHYTIDAAEFENNLPAVLKVYSHGYEVAESFPIFSLPEDEDVIIRSVRMKPEQPEPPVPPTPPIPPDPPVPPTPPVPPVPPEPVPPQPVPPTPVPTPVDPGGEIVQTRDTASLACIAFVTLALCGAFGLFTSAKRKN